MQKDELVAAFENEYGHTPSEDELATYSQAQVRPQSRLERNKKRKEVVAKRQTKAKLGQQLAPTDQNVTSTATPGTIDQPFRAGRRARVSVIGALLGGVSLFSFYKLPFLQISLPTLGERTIYLADLLKQSNVLLSNLGFNHTSLTVIMMVMLICPILYIVTQLIPSFFAKAIGLLIAFAQFILVVYLAGSLYHYFQNAGLSAFNININQFFGSGFYFTLMMPMVMFCWSLVTIAGKKVKIK